MVWLKKFLQQLWYYITYPYYYVKEEIAFRKRLKELREKDPFIYD